MNIGNVNYPCSFVMIITNVHYQCSLPPFITNVHCQYSFGVPSPPQANKDLKHVKQFKLALRHAQHAAIFETFRAFNRKGGAVGKFPSDTTNG